MPEQIDTYVKKTHAEIMADAETKITNFVESGVGKSLSDMTSIEFDSIKNPMTSLQGQVVYIRLLSQIKKAEEIKNRVIEFNTRYSTWIKDGSPGNELINDSSCIGFNKINLADNGLENG